MREVTREWRKASWKFNKILLPFLPFLHFYHLIKKNIFFFIWEINYTFKGKNSLNFRQSKVTWIDPSPENNSDPKLKAWTVCPSVMPSCRFCLCILLANSIIVAYISFCLSNFEIIPSKNVNEYSNILKDVFSYLICYTTLWKIIHPSIDVSCEKYACRILNYTIKPRACFRRLTYLEGVPPDVLRKDAQHPHHADLVLAP